VTIGAALDDEVAEVLLGFETDHRPQRELARPRFDAPGRQLDVLPPQCVLDVRDRHLSRRQRLAVEPDAHRIAATADDADAGDAGHGRQPVDDVALGIVGEVEHRHRIGRERERYDGVGVRVGFDDLRRIGLGRQAADHARDAVAHVVRRGVDVAVDVELDANLRALVFAIGLDLQDPLDAGDRVLDDLRYLGFDDRGRRAAVGGRDRDRRAVDVGVLAHGQPLQRHETEDYEQHAEHGRKDRPSHG
jgi:hypothetical protein